MLVPFLGLIAHLDLRPRWCQVVRFRKPSVRKQVQRDLHRGGDLPILLKYPPLYDGNNRNYVKRRLDSSYVGSVPAHRLRKKKMVMKNRDCFNEDQSNLMKLTCDERPRASLDF